MKKIVLILACVLTLGNAKASVGERPSKDSNQNVTHYHVSDMDAFIRYDGGDTLSILIESSGDEDVKIKLLGGNVTLLSDRSHRKTVLKRVYVISAFPPGDYKIRLKKGNYVVEKSFTKRSGATEID